MTAHNAICLFAVGAESHALSFAWKHLTREGLCTIFALLIVSIFSWSVIISKARQLMRARKTSKKFYSQYRASRDPLEVFRTQKEFPGSPAYEVYLTGAEELSYHLKNNPVLSQNGAGHSAAVDLIEPVQADAPPLAVYGKISRASFDSVQVALERSAAAEAMSLEKGMIILSTAVAGGPFIGLFGTVWGVMETFSGIGIANAASLNAMAPGVAAALLATVAGLSVAIPAMFAYNYMVTSIRTITQELDGFSAEFATAMEHKYVDNRSLVDELRQVLVLQPRAEVFQEELASR